MEQTDIIEFNPTPKQNEAFEALENNTILLYGGAIRGAKSYFGCLAIITFCFEYPNSRWAMIRESRVVLESTLLVTFRENFLDKGFQQYVRSFNQTDLVLTWNNGSQIVFMGENFDNDKELNRFRGLEINGAFLDEVNELREQTLDKVIERSGSWFHSPGCPSKILMSCNPSNNWVKDRFYTPWKENKLPPGVCYIQAKITDNPHIPAAYLESLKMLPRYQYMAFVEGDWDVSIKVGGEFYKCFELDVHVSKCDYDPALALHVSWDDNVNPYLPAGIFQLRKTDAGTVVCMIDEIAGVTPNNTVKAVCNEIIRKYQGHVAGMFIYGDATAQKEDTKMEKGHDFYRIITDALAQFRPQRRVSKSNPSVAMRGMWINTILEKEISGIVFRIDPKCKKAINDFVLLKEASDGTKLKEMDTDPKTKVRFQKVGHFTDLTDYLLCTAFANEFSQYQSGGSTKIPNFGKTTSRNSY